MKAAAIVHPAATRSLAPGLETVGAPPSTDAWRREMEKAQAALWLGHGAVGATASPAAPAPRNADSPARPSTGPLRGPGPRWASVAAQRTASDPAAPETGDPAGDLPGGAAIGAAGSIPKHRNLQPLPGDPLIVTASSVHTDAGPSEGAKTAALRSVASCVATTLGARVELSQGDARPQAPLSMVSPTQVRPLQDHDHTVPEPPAPRLRPAPDSEAPDATSVRVHCQFTDAGLLVWIGAAAHSHLDGKALASGLQESLKRHAQRLSCLTCNGQVVWQDVSPLFPPHEEPTWPSKQ